VNRGNECSVTRWENRSMIAEMNVRLSDQSLGQVRLFGPLVTAPPCPSLRSSRPTQRTQDSQIVTVSPIPQVSKAPSSMPIFLHSSARRRGGSVTSSIVNNHVLLIVKIGSLVKGEGSPPVHPDRSFSANVFKYPDAILRSTMDG
jgi:hypothetical protein